MDHFSQNMQWMRKTLLSLRQVAAKNMRLTRILLSLLLAAAVTVALGLYLPPRIEAFNDSVFGKVTILDNPELVEALNAAEDKGVIMAVHGYHHEDYRLLDAETTTRLVDKAVAVFEKAGLTAEYWYNPLCPFSWLSDPVQDAITRNLTRRIPRMNLVDELGETAIPSCGLPMDCVCAT